MKTTCRISKHGTSPIIPIERSSSNAVRLQKRLLGILYAPEKPTIVTVPRMNYIAVRGEGDPNDEDVNLRMLVKRITIHQNEDRSIDIRIEMNGAFDANVSVFLKSA